MVLLGLKIVLVHVNAELHFFQDDILLRLLSGLVALALFVEELSIILNATHRRDGSGRDLHQIEAFFFRQLYCFIQGKDAYLFTLGANYADFTSADTVIDADKTLVDLVLRCKWAKTKLRGSEEKYSMALALP